MKVLFTANIPSPYRVDFFNELGKLCDLTVIFERRRASSRNSLWQGSGAKNYREIYLSGIKTGEAEVLSFGLIQYIKDRSFDKIVIGMYSTPSSMIAIEYMRLHNIPFYLSTDGGFIKSESKPVRILKKHLIGAAAYWFSPSDKATEYLLHYGAVQKRVYKYPFTSLSDSDLRSAFALSQEKQQIRKALGVKEERVLLSVGRFSYAGGYGKGYDTLMYAAQALPPSIGIYIVGDEPTPEFSDWKREKNLSHIHFIGFKAKEELAQYYAMADVFILLTRGDVWGLVINEAMSFRLPVITTRQCLAGVELIKEKENGFLIEAGDVAGTLDSIHRVFSSEVDLVRMGAASGEIIKPYTVENMALSHYTVLSDT